MKSAASPHEHYIERCQVCNAIVSQCRCMGPHVTRWTTCEDCASKGTGEPTTMPYGHDDDRMDTYEQHEPSIPFEVLQKVRVGLYGHLFGWPVWRVDGCFIRCNIDLDFVAGGNPGRYRYVPEGEIWVADAVSPIDVAATMAHELVECLIMQRQGISYDKAHEAACTIERPFRLAVGSGKFIVNTPLEGASRWIKSRASV